MIQVGKRSVGRIPNVYAKEDMPLVAFEGSVKRMFGSEGSIKSGELGSLSWSEKFCGGSKGAVERGFHW